MGFIPFTFIDFLDILLVAGLLFIVYKAMKGTSAPYIMVGRGRCRLRRDRSGTPYPHADALANLGR